MADQVTDPGLEGFSDDAWKEPGEDGLTSEQLAFRVHMKREQAAQDAGWIEPPGPDAPLEAVEAPEPPPEEAPDDEPDVEAESEPEPAEEEESPPEEEPGTEEDPEEQEALDEDEEFYVARYRDRDAAEEAFAEKDRTIQRLYQELNERQEQAQQQEQQQGPQQLDVRAWSEWSAEAVESGAGIRGASRALESGGPQAFDIYMAHWQAVDDPDERVQATAFNNEVQRQFAEQRALQAVQPQLEQAGQRTAAEEAQLARQVVSSQRPDFEEYGEEMDRLIQTEDGPLPEETKLWLAEMANSGVEGKVRAWDYLYLAAVASRGPRRQQASSTEKRRRTAAADAAKIAATVSTSEGSAVRTPPNEAELAVIRKRNAIREKLGQPLLDEQ